MGMSASQARYLSLVSRQSDIEYQGQQINQQRTTLAGQINALYNSLLEMEVPTPPSTKSFTKTVYSGRDNATTFKIASVAPHGSEYTVDLEYTKTGHSITPAGSMAITTIPEELSGKILDDVDSEMMTKSVPASYTGTQNDKNKDLDQGSEYFIPVTEVASSYEGKYYVKEPGSNNKFVEYDNFDKANAAAEENHGTVYIKKPGKDINTDDSPDKTEFWKVGIYTKATEATPIKVTDAMLPNLYVKDGDSWRAATKSDFKIDSEGNLVFDTEKHYFMKNSGNEKIDNPQYTKDGNNFQVGGNDCMTLEEAKKRGYFDQQTYEDYIKSVTTTFPDLKEGDFKVFFTAESGSKVSTVHFVKKTDFSVIQNGTSKQIPTYEYKANGSYTEDITYEGCQLAFDNSGRITTLKIPKTDDNGTVYYTTVNVTAEEETDQAAYEDAMNEYTYKKGLYDQKQEEINAQTSVIQQQDKNLELKLTRLDNERNAVHTELEAIKTVLKDAVEQGFKTFSG